LNLPRAERAASDLQEGRNMNRIESILFKIEVVIEKDGNKATASVPAELRLTPVVVQYLTEALNKRGLTLTNMNVAPEHTKELENLPNVVLKKGSE